jgi:AcrR family transcriptional regulator
MKGPDCETREAILRAGLTAFARSGYAGASVQDIIGATEFSKPTLYYYFGSKAGIFKALLDRAYDECYCRMAAAAARHETLEAQLVEVLASVFEFVRQERELTRLVFATSFAAPAELPKKARNEERKRRNLDLLESLIKRALKRGELDSEFTSKELAFGIHGALVFRVMLQLTLDEGSLDRRTARRIVQLFLKGAARKE